MEIRERPIIFKSEMVRAIFEDRKTMTRRPVKWPLKVMPHLDDIYIGHDPNGIYIQWKGFPEFGLIRPRWKVGDHLWVRETWNLVSGHYVYRADCCAVPFDWKPSIHMPRNASRINLEIIDIKVERLQEISPEDALNEGIQYESLYGKFSVPDYDQFCEAEDKQILSAFQKIWDSIYGNFNQWHFNPYVWVIEFKRITK